ncbi:aminotransferase class IV [Shimia sediminis]|uniref:aminotransferase class IV n=1 Tax=Shimia sediminis TaxID=2497945 RepID=UPI000F8D1806|nr:aminotransferase class IV [Shimia sediminis]
MTIKTPPDLSNGAAWMGGRVIPIADAGVPVTDWGLTHADIAYDVVPVWHGGFFRLEDYLTRFIASLTALRMDVGMDRDAMRAALAEMVAASGLRQAYVAMVAARGRNPIPGDRDPRNCDNHFYAWVVPYVHVVPEEIAARGTHVWIGKSVRRIPQDSVNPRVKNYHWGDFTSALFEAKDAGYDTAMLLDHAGNVTEGPGFNVFALFGDRLVTADHGVLHGITRQTTLEMADSLGLKTETCALPLEELMQADEVFLSSSGGGVVPVTRVDDRVFSNGAPGPVAQRLRATYFDWMQQDRLRTPITYPA